MPTASTPSPADVAADEAPEGPTHPAPLRIAAHTAAAGWPGAGIDITRLLAGLDRLGHAVRLYCDDRHVRERARDLGLLVRRQTLGNSLAIHHALRFATELRQRKPDVLVLAGADKLGLGTLAARRAEIPRVIAWIGVETELPRRRRERLAYSRAIHVVVVPTAGMRRRFRDAHPDFTGDVITIRPGVPGPIVRGGPAQRAMLGVPLDAPLIGSAGPLVERKRYDRLIEVLAELPKAHAVIVGEGVARRALERLADRAGVANRLHLPGYQTDLGPVFDAMDVYLVTSDAEGMSRAMLEAMAAGLPVVSTPVSGAVEALESPDHAGSAPDPGSGYGPGVVAGFEAASLVAALRGLVEDRARLRAMGAAAERVARERFDESRTLAEWDAVLTGEEAP